MKNAGKRVAGREGDGAFEKFLEQSMPFFCRIAPYQPMLRLETE